MAIGAQRSEQGEQPQANPPSPMREGEPLEPLVLVWPWAFEPFPRNEPLTAQRGASGQIVCLCLCVSEGECS